MWPHHAFFNALSVRNFSQTLTLYIDLICLLLSHCCTQKYMQQYLGRKITSFPLYQMFGKAILDTFQAIQLHQQVTHSYWFAYIDYKAHLSSPLLKSL